jgi:hypothetical protein
MKKLLLVMLLLAIAYITLVTVFGSAGSALHVVEHGGPSADGLRLFAKVMGW